MKWLRTLVLFDKGAIMDSRAWRTIHASYVRCIQQVDFPAGSGSLTLRRKVKRADGQWDRNGVVYLKRRFFQHMVTTEGWRKEVEFNLSQGRAATEVRVYPGKKTYREPVTSKFGGFDFLTVASGGVHVAIEWETGNISSSHRAVNKLAIALVNGAIQAGVLIVPSRELYAHLTDRIGNIGELSGYLPMWKSLGAGVRRGLLAISVVEHDALTDDFAFPYLTVGSDGRAREGRAKRK